MHILGAPTWRASLSGAVFKMSAQFLLLKDE